jgi:hypothetical protein
VSKARRAQLFGETVRRFVPVRRVARRVARRVLRIILVAPDL